MITICDPNFWQKLGNDDCTKLIVVVDADFGISKGGSIPWAFGDDLDFFRGVTQDFAVIMGRRTFFSIPNAPLKNRVNCVISRTIKRINGAFVFNSPDRALEKYKNAWIIGGGEIYNYALKNNLVDYAVVTQIHKSFEADKFIEQSLLKSFKKQKLFTAKNYDITSYLRA